MVVAGGIEMFGLADDVVMLIDAVGDMAFVTGDNVPIFVLGCDSIPDMGTKSRKNLHMYIINLINIL